MLSSMGVVCGNEHCLFKRWAILHLSKIKKDGRYCLVESYSSMTDLEAIRLHPEIRLLLLGTEDLLGACLSGDCWFLVTLLNVMRILKWITGFISSYLLVELTGGSKFLSV